MNEQLMDVMKLIADKRMEDTLNIVFREDKEYRKMAEAVIGMEKLYDSLELGSDIRDVIDQLLADRDGVNMEKVSLAYWAGMMDAVLILREMGIIEL